MTEQQSQGTGASTANSRSNSRIKLLLLMAIAFAPLLVAYATFFYFPEVIPKGTTNNGELIQPPFQAEALAADLAQQPSWTLLHLGASSCPTDCQQALYLSRQVVAGLGKDSDRVARLLLTPTPLAPAFTAFIAKEHPSLQVRLLNTSPLEAISTTRPLILLMDPNGNILLHYNLETAGKPLLEDLKHLLRLSKIG